MLDQFNNDVCAEIVNRCDALDADLAAGRITQTEFNAQIRKLDRLAEKAFATLDQMERAAP